MVSGFIKAKADRLKAYQTWHLLFVSLGFVLSMLIIIAVFELKMRDNISTVDISTGHVTSELLFEVPITEQPPPPPPMITADQIREVSDEEIIETIEVTLDIEMTQNTRVEQVIFSDFTGQAPVEEVAEEIFTIVEQQPVPVGGMSTFYKYIGEHLRYPTRAARQGIEGRVFVQFVVERDGSLTDVQVVRGIGGGCDEEAVRVVQGAPKWEPGRQRGRPVRVRMVLPILFQLN
ncbi:MAG: energy transducer TonB [Cyclobacteriaceae bacterium]|nr:energy transducer TonB [Cyclobacteriaceae bacterium]